MEQLLGTVCFVCFKCFMSFMTTEQEDEEEEEGEGERLKTKDKEGTRRRYMKQNSHMAKGEVEAYCDYYFLL